ncbi:hypothetical protein AALP_AA2G061200 [Arabis alpina]|uniref:Retrotransposon gag domain-containing protein n=1 Tax=Arabis alpina TaxID=50452 RepID=A0A087HFM4_ARAAL|nr:hypothetical protein AALP_AA2G061200 [Arabis alpina]
MPARIIRVEGNKLWIRGSKAEPPIPRAAEQATVTFHAVERVIANWQHQFDTITQGDKTVEEYFKEFMLLKTATKCNQDPDAVLLRFWNGLRMEFHVALSGNTYHTAARLADDATILKNMGRDREPRKEQGMFGDLGNPVPGPPMAAAHEDRHIAMPTERAFFLNAYRIHSDLRINPSPGKEAGRGSNGWLEESEDKSDIWSEVEPEWKRYWDSPPSATNPAGLRVNKVYKKVGELVEVRLRLSFDYVPFF